MEGVLHLVGSMDLRPPASADAIVAAERQLARRLPPEYREFLRRHNGGEGPIGAQGWARFAPVEDLPREQAVCSEFDHLAEWLLFGTNGAGEAFLFDAAGEVVVAPWIGDREDAIPQGRFAEFVRRLGEGRALERGM